MTGPIVSDKKSTQFSGFKPNFLGIGAAKSSTTAVATLLASHPEIGFPVDGTKELHYFDERYDDYSTAWYFSHFRENAAVGEYTPSYLFVPDCRDRIYATLGPDTRFIVALRNPVDRAFSHYCHAVNNWWQESYRALNYPVETLSFEDALKAEPARLKNGKYHIRHLSYFRKGLYADQLVWYFQRFKREKFYIYLFEDYATDPARILGEICQFLGVHPRYRFRGLERKYNAQTNRPLDPSTREMLLAKYLPSIEALEVLLELDLSIWKRKGTLKRIRNEQGRVGDETGETPTEDGKSFSTGREGGPQILRDPIFLVGCPRSGTTLLQCMLCASDETFSLPETHYFCDTLPALRLDFQDSLNSALLEKIVSLLKKRMLLSMPSSLYAKLRTLARDHQLTGLDVFQEVVELYRPTHDQTRSLRLIEKTPFHVLYLRQIVECFHSAKFINMVRHPFDVVSSRMVMPTEPHKSIMKFVNDWIRLVEAAKDFSDQNHGRLLTIRYEDLVHHTERTLRKVCEFLSLEFQKDMRSAFAAQYEVCTLAGDEPWKGEVKTGRVLNKIGIWRDRISPGQAWLVEQEAKRLMDEYDYEGVATPPEEERTLWRERDALAIKRMPRLERSNLHLEWANRYFRQKRYGDAEKRYSEALSIRGIPAERRFDVILGLANCLRDQNRSEEAQKYYREALAINSVPKERKVHAILGLGLAYTKQGRDTDAEKAYVKALSFGEIKDVDRFLLLLRLGDVYLNQGRLQEAVQRLNEALSVQGIPEKERFHTLSILGGCLFRQKQYKEAEEKYEEAFRLPMTSDSRFKIASHLVQCSLFNGKPDKAKRLLELIMASDEIEEGDKLSLIMSARKLTGMLPHQGG